MVLGAHFDMVDTLAVLVAVVVQKELAAAVRAEKVTVVEMVVQVGPLVIVRVAAVVVKVVQVQTVAATTVVVAVGLVLHQLTQLVHL